MAVQAAKRTIKRGLECATVAEGVDIEAEEFANLFTTHDQKEGMRAFIEKRDPVYLGK